MHKLHLLALAFLAAAGSPEAAAADINRSAITMPAGACQSALPVFDGVIRKRPLGVQNEGTTAAFVTCGATTPGQARTSRVVLAFNNSNSHDVTIACTLVAGYTESTAVYRPQSVTIPANWGDAMFWVPTQLPSGIPYFASAAFSCTLPPGTGITRVQTSYTEDVGQ
ncbi:hypothetical protein [Luteimonas sp. MC1828]|uniref:hypothetical protein n=1 Tax=Luteimonas sp. MC1828 TaxID=2799787 RepID=UPI0018F22A29|nr:hypothetical protein [Luteimonas sp. MC1828]MBJ7576001.1 hypothetical protein [Luteimonas sp. MC1828]